MRYWGKYFASIIIKENAFNYVDGILDSLSIDDCILNIISINQFMYKDDGFWKLSINYFIIRNNNNIYKSLIIDLKTKMCCVFKTMIQMSYKFANT